MNNTQYFNSDLAIVFALKNYPKMTYHMLKSSHWIKSYNDFSSRDF